MICSKCGRDVLGGDEHECRDASPIKKELLALRKIVLDLEADLDRQLWDDEHVKSCRENDIDVAQDCEHHVVVTQAMRVRITKAVADMRDISNET